MILDKFNDFVEFKNTKEGKKVDDPDKDLLLKFSKIRQNKWESVKIKLNSGLVKSIKENKIFSFKLLFNESTFDICLRYDNSSNAFTIVGKASRARGEHEFFDKYVTATMLKVMKEKKAKSITYKGKYYKDKLAYIFTIDSVSKAE